jgi:CrcB protein
MPLANSERLMTILIVMLAGGTGALLRFIVDGLVRTKLGRIFPWGTLIINASGSLLLGIITGLVLYHHDSSVVKLIIGTGFCGGYTTFSTASFETVRLIEERRFHVAVFNALGGLTIVVAAAALGLGLTHL